jgi:hypothetical protein
VMPKASGGGGVRPGSGPKPRPSRAQRLMLTFTDKGLEPRAEGPLQSGLETLGNSPSGLQDSAAPASAIIEQT